ncbi:MAG: orotidine-5'-phosphate decarboxylase [Candidatus Diapherotrites archaeon]|nr:orotidine-5'-phosphate decarboxylase [Candidatus Diapherotrites archaeon]
METMTFTEALRIAAEEMKSVACFGLDPVLERIPIREGNPGERIESFYSGILDKMKAENVFPGAFKPNYAFFAQYGFDGLYALQAVIRKAQSTGVPVILDVKRGDIGSTSTAYAREGFEFWGADALTVSPFMGTDSVQPFIEFTETKPQGIYVLNRTSNSGAKDFQGLKMGSSPLFMKVSRKIAQWSALAPGNVGAVVGATNPKELRQIVSFYAKQKNPVPLLIPGVGTQGADVKEVMESLRKSRYDLSLARINSSSALNYAYEKTNSSDYAGEAVKALKKLNQEIGFGEKRKLTQ